MPLTMRKLTATVTGDVGLVSGTEVEVNNTAVNPVNAIQTGLYPIGANLEYRIRGPAGLIPFMHGRFSMHGATNIDNPITTERRSFGIAASSNFPFLSYQTIGTQMQIASTSALDTSAGTGVRTIGIVGLDDANEPAFEIVTMNGQTPVSFAETDWFQFEYIYSNTTGSDGRNRGDIFISDSTDTFTGGIPNTQTLWSMMASPDATTYENISTIFSYPVRNTGAILGTNGNYYIEATVVVPVTIDEYYLSDFGSGQQIIYKSGPLVLSNSVSFDFDGAGRLVQGDIFFQYISVASGTSQGAIFYQLAIQNLAGTIV